MIVRLAFFALMALGLLGFGTVAWISTRPPPPDADTVAASTKVMVLIAAKPVRAGTLLKPEDIGAKEITQREAGDDASFDGLDARRTLAGAMVRAQPAARRPDAGRGRACAPATAASSPPCWGRACARSRVGVDAVSGTAGLIWPGDRVDVILTQADQRDPACLSPGARRGDGAAGYPRHRHRPAAGARRRPDDAAGQQQGPHRHARSHLGRSRARLGGHRLGRLSLAVRSADRNGVPRMLASFPRHHLGQRRFAGAGHQRGAAGTRDVLHVFPGAGDRKEFRF